jgi:hypothetical protein
MPRQVDAKVCARADAQAIEAKRSADWCGIWSLPISAAAIALAAMIYFVTGDKSGAAFVLIGTATFVGIVLHAGAPRTS